MIKQQVFNLDNQNNYRCPICSGVVQANIDAVFITCKNCGLFIRRISDKVEDLYRYGWLNPLDNMNFTGGTTPFLANNYTTELMRSLSVDSLKGQTILDFGGGRGEMGLALLKAGAGVVVVDPYSFMQLRKQGFNAVKSLDELVGKKNLNGAVAIDVVEHLPTPWKELNMIRKLLRSGGWLYLSTPNGQSLNARLNRGNWREARNPSHLLLFTPKSLEGMLEKAGFKGFKRLRWRVEFSENKCIQAKDWLIRLLKLDGVLRYLANV
jgi:SAM-dependent methyltransferase